MTMQKNKVRLVESDFIFCSDRRLFSGRSFFSGSSLSSSCGFSLSLGSCELCFLLSYGFSLSLVDSLLSLETSLHFFLLLVGHSHLEFVNLCLTGFLPSCETAFCLSFVKSTFLHTTLEVLHQENTFVRED